MTESLYIYIYIINPPCLQKKEKMLVSLSFCPFSSKLSVRNIPLFLTLTLSKYKLPCYSLLSFCSSISSNTLKIKAENKVQAKLSMNIIPHQSGYTHSPWLAQFSKNKLIQVVWWVCVVTSESFVEVKSNEAYSGSQPVSLWWQKIK